MDDWYGDYYKVPINYRRETDVTNYSLTVNREKLLELLQERRKEIDTFYDEKVAELDEQLESAKDPNKAWAAYYSEMAKRVKDGTLIRDDSAARGQKWVVAPGTPAQPTLPEPKDVAALAGERTSYEERRVNNKRPYDTAIDMLTIAVGETVEIPTSEYEHLLKRPTTLY
jgi:hypothetical protein